MARVLLVGESWFVYSVHQKGFDTFTTTEYTEGGTEFVAALRAAGHDVTHLPSHMIETSFPTSTAELQEVADVVIISDVGANSFLLSKATFNDSRVEPDRLSAIRDFVLAGGGLLMVGGYMTFSGIDAKARWAFTPVQEVLPVRVLERDDRVEMPSGCTPAKTEDHPITRPLSAQWPNLLGINEVEPLPESTVLATASAHPLLVVSAAGNGRTAAFTSDLAPHWATPEFLAWDGYAPLFDNTVRWLANELSE